jgi:hypothetical protein
MIGAVMAVLAMAILTASVALAQDQPDATFTFSAWSVSAGVGFVWGEGVLTYQGKEHCFSVDGVSVPVVGASRVFVSGKVYHLRNLEDFAGQFVAATAEATLGMGAGATAMRNQQGVVITLLSTTQGFELKLASSGVNVTLEKEFVPDAPRRSPEPVRTLG